MNPNQIRVLITLVLCLALAFFLGYLVAVGKYDVIRLLIFVALGVFAIVAPGYSALIAFGLICPFSLPIPFVYNAPFIASILGVCITKYMVRRWIVHHNSPAPQTRLPVGFYLFFAWVVFRYCLDPVFPNVQGFGENVSGFRAYLNYALSLSLVVFLPLFLRSRGDALAVVRWIGIFSFFFVIFFVPLIFTKSLTVTANLTHFGMYVSAFDNGWLRFVVLPGFGGTLVALGLLPNLTSWSSGRRRLLVVVGVAAVIMGGNRASFLMTLLLFLTIAYVRRGFAAAFWVAVAAVICLAAFRYAGENFRFDRGTGFFRILALTSQRVAVQSGADTTLLWRKVRWERAMEDIYARPFMGHGYGGLERAFMFVNMAQFEAAAVEVDVVTGGIHNGYIAGTRALGVPGLLLFLCACVSQVILNWKQAMLYRTSDPVISDLHCFVFANLAALTIGIYTGADLNNTFNWFFLILGVVVAGIKRAEATTIEGSRVQAAELALAPRAAAS